MAGLISAIQVVGLRMHGPCHITHQWQRLLLLLLLLPLGHVFLLFSYIWV